MNRDFKLLIFQLDKTEFFLPNLQILKKKEREGGVQGKDPPAKLYMKKR